MNRKSVFGVWEATCFLITVICTQLFLSLPRVLAESAETAGWILVLYAGILSIIGFTIMQMLYKRFEGKDILDVSEIALGNVGRVLFGLLFNGYLIFIISVVLREFSEDMKIISLNRSPISFISLFFIVGMVSGAYFGIENIVRFGAIAVPVISLGFVFILISSWKFIDWVDITPILGSGAYDLFVKGIPRISIYSGIIGPFLLGSYIKSHKNFKKICYTSLIFSIIALTLGTLAYSLVYPYPSSTESFLPIYQLARLISFGRFFERIEAVFVLMWATSALLYLSVVLYLIAYTFKKTFKLSYYKPLVIPFAILVFTISLLPTNQISAIELESNVFRNYAWVVSYLSVTLILAIAVLRKKFGKKEAKNKQ